MDLTHHVKKFRILADECRLRVLTLLGQGPKCVSEIMQHIKVPQTLLSHHLRILREAQLVTFERQGNRNVYRLSEGLKTGDSAYDLGCCRVEFK